MKNKKSESSREKGKDKSIVVLYHKNCPDGFGAAWVMRKKLKDKAEYIPVVHQNPPLASLVDKEIYMVDFCYNADVMEKLKKKNKKIFVIDHHISQKEAVKISDGGMYDIKHSGSVLTWKYIFPDKKVPLFLRHIEDRDIWKFELNNTKEYLAATDCLDMDFKLWDRIAADFENPAKRKKYLEQGKSIISYQNMTIAQVVGNAEPVKFEGKRAYAVNCPVIVSEIGHVLANMAPDGIGIIWNYKMGNIKISLRGNGKADVSKIAAKYGGGGHKGAASFMIPAEIKLPWKKFK